MCPNSTSAPLLYKVISAPAVEVPHVMVGYGGYTGGLTYQYGAYSRCAANCTLNAATSPLKSNDTTLKVSFTPHQDTSILVQ